MVTIYEPAMPTIGNVIALIPAFNEERFIGSMVLSIQPYVDKVVIVDDGSTDRTAEIARKAGAYVIQHERNAGKAAAVNSGFAYLRQCKIAALVMLDGDGQHRAEDIPRLLTPIMNQQADIVLGSRFKDIKSTIPGYRQVGQHGLTMITNLASGVRVSDSQSGFRAFSPRAVAALSFRQGGFSVESEMQFQVQEHQLRVVEVGIQVVYAERAKRNPLRHGMQVVHGVMQLVGQTRPLLYFGLAGASSLLLSVVLGLYIVEIYATSQQLVFSYSVMLVFLVLWGVMMLFVGVILHSTRGMLIDFRRALLERLAAEQRQDSGHV